MLVHYCSRECQVADWTAHKPECRRHLANKTILDDPGDQKAFQDVTRLLRNNTPQLLFIALKALLIFHGGRVVPPESDAPVAVMATWAPERIQVTDVVAYPLASIDEVLGRADLVDRMTLEQKLSEGRAKYPGTRVIMMVMGVTGSLKSFGRVVPLTIRPPDEASAMAIISAWSMMQLIDSFNRQLSIMP